MVQATRGNTKPAYCLCPSSEMATRASGSWKVSSSSRGCSRLGWNSPARSAPVTFNCQPLVKRDRPSPGRASGFTVMLKPCFSGCLPIKVGRRCRAAVILGPRSSAALPEWGFVNQPDKHGCNNGQIQKPLLGGFAALMLKSVLRFWTPRSRANPRLFVICPRHRLP